MHQDTNSLDRIAAEASEWFVAIRTGSLSPTERQRFVDWLQASPVHVQEYLGVAQAWRAFGTAEAWPGTDTPALLHDAQRTSNVVPLMPVTAPPAQASAGRGKPPVAVAALALLTLLLGGLLVSRSPFLEVFTQGVYATARGEQRSIVLEDGSVVQLNALSRIDVAFDGKQRRIELSDGEAFFRVAHDAARPFYVVTPAATIRAVGTEFNVYSRDRLQVVVIDGRVRVAPTGAATPAGADPSAAAPAAISLGVNETVEVSGRGVVIREASRSPTAATAWMQRAWCSRTSASTR